MTKPTLEQRLETAEAEIADLKIQLASIGVTKEEIDAMRDDVAHLRSELTARGVDPLPNPARRRPKLPPETVAAIRRRNAAHARGAKAVGSGQDKVGTKATQRRLQRQAGASLKETRKKLKKRAPPPSSKKS